jgi:hypothetical protein
MNVQSSRCEGSGFSLRVQEFRADNPIQSKARLALLNSEPRTLNHEPKRRTLAAKLL